ncbi:MAG: TolC family protein [Desulfoprunum sp.]
MYESWAGLPSALLERYPDLRQAEQQLIAANARVGEAKALFFPAITLTGTFGAVSTELGDLVNGEGATVASPGVDLLQPLYAGGSLTANYRAALARLQQAGLSYRQTGLNALREVADALSRYGRSADEIAAQRRRETAAREGLRLAEMRYRAGVVSYLEVLDAQRQLYAAETDRAQSELGRRTAAVQLYLALGGGW